LEAVGSGVVGPPLKLDEEKKMGGGGGGGREGGDLGRGEKRGEGVGTWGSGFSEILKF
jgi:hypothetical protein